MSDHKDRDIPLLLKTEWAAGVVLTLLILYLHYVFMQNAGGLWRDEVHSVQLATMPSLSSLWAAMRFDSFPILFTLVVRLWAGIGWGETDTGLRLLGLLAGSSIIGAAWLNARLIRRSTPIIFLFLFGFSSLTIRFGDSIRPYGLGIMLILLASGLIWSVVESPAPLKVLAAAAVSALSVQCLYTNAVLLFAICLGGIAVALYNGMWKRAALVVGIGIAAALSLLPYLGMIRRSSEWSVLVQYPNTFKQSWEVLSRHSLGSAGALVFWLWCGLFLSGIFLAVYRVSSRSGAGASRRERDMAVFFTTAMVVSTAAFFLLFKFMKVTPHPWYFLSPMAIAAVSLDALFGMDRRPWRALRVALAVLVVGLTLNTVGHRVMIRQTNTDLIAEELGKTASKDDLILISPWYVGITFQRYYKGAAPWTTIPPMEDLSLVRYDLLKEKMISPYLLSPVFKDIDDTLDRGGRLWLVGNFYSRYDPETGQLPFVLPPAPNGPYGWRNGPYLRSWSMQTEYFIYSRASQLKQLPPAGDKAINPYEKSSIVVVEGR